MLIRAPHESDTATIVTLAGAMHAEGAFKHLQFDPGKVRLLIAQIIHNSSYFGIVCEHEDQIIGMMAGYASEFFFGSDLIATDMVLYVEQTRRGGINALRMIERYVAWAIRKGCVEIQLGQTTGINPDIVDKLYTHAGFTMVGQIYKRRIT